jgi:hypothetical protein
VKIEVALGEILSHGEWCINEGQTSRDEKVLLTAEEVNTYGLLQYIMSNLDKVNYTP